MDWITGAIGAVLGILGTASFIGIKFREPIKLMANLIGYIQGRKTGGAVYTGAFAVGRAISILGRRHWGVKAWEKEHEPRLEELQKQLNRGVRDGWNKDD